MLVSLRGSLYRGTLVPTRSGLGNTVVLFAYTMTWDTGFSPCVYGQLSLACCKSIMRHTIAERFKSDKEIYLMGLLGKTMAKRRVYQMITSILLFISLRYRV